MSPSATSTHFLNPSRDGDSTTLLGSLVHCFYCSKLTTDASRSSRFPCLALGTTITTHLGSTAMPRRAHSPAVNPSRCSLYYGAAEMTELLADLTVSLLRIQVRILTYFWKPIQPLPLCSPDFTISSAKQDLKKHRFEN